MDITDLHMIKKIDVREQAFNQLLKMITNGVCKAGDKLPSESELTEILGVSRISVREAIQKLNALGLIDTYRGKGTYVRNITVANYMTPLMPMIICADKSDLLKLIECRKVIEPAIVAVAVDAATDADIESLEQIIERMSNDKNSLIDFSRYSKLFLLELANASHNPYLTQIYQFLVESIDKALKGVISQEGIGCNIAYTTDLLNSLRERDKATMEKHIVTLWENVEKSICG